MKQSDYEKLSTPPRQKTSVAIIGLDRSTPDDIVKDGACEELHNVRYKDNAWRPVHEHKVAAHPNLPISTADTSYNIVYKHPATPESHYVVEIKVNGKYYYYDYDSAITHWKDAITLIASFDKQQKVSHFGNVLFFNSDSYLLLDGVYSHYANDTTHPILDYTNRISPETRINPDYFAVDTPNIELTFERKEDGDITTIKLTLAQDAWYPMEIFNSALQTAPQGVQFRFLWLFKLDVSPSTKETDWATDPFPTIRSGYWSGEHAMFAVLRMNDGTYLNPSSVIINTNQNDYSILEGFVVGDMGNIYIDGTGGVWPFRGRGLVTKYAPIAERESFSSILIPYYYVNMMSTDVKVSVPADIDDTLIQSIALFSTLNFPIFNYETIKAVDTFSGGAKISKLFKDNDILNSQFYKAHEVNIADCALDENNNTKYFNFTINGSTFEQLSTSLFYEPSISEVISGKVSLDYNNRLHLADISSSIKSEYFEEVLEVDPNEDNPTKIGVVINRNGYVTTAWSEDIFGSELKEKCNTLISIHNSAATDIIFKRANLYTAKLKNAVANNIAYFYFNPTDDFRYPPIYIGKLALYKGNIKSDKINEPNRIQVSAPNNCFSFPFENSYAVGSSNNRIIALQSAAIEMSDAKFGEMPLYAFTTEGIFALQAGSETLYSNVIPINYDKIINPNTLAINGAIVYITEKGVHLLTNQGTQVISSPIHDSAGMPPLDFLRSCKIIYPKQYNEIVLLNEADKEGVAYVYNLDAGYWSTRDLEGIKLNTDELYLGNAIYDLADEDESKALPMTITTRPIKLGNIEFKRLETIAPRMSSGDKDFASHIHLTGSVDGTNYMTLREHDLDIEAHKVNPFTLRRTPFSAKYFKYHMFMEPKQGETFNPSITHIDFEWYIKFRRRMR